MATQTGTIFITDVMISTKAYQRLMNGKMGKTEAGQFMSDMATNKDLFTKSVIAVIKEFLRIDKVYRDRAAKTGMKFPVDTIVTGLINSNTVEAWEKANTPSNPKR